MTKTLVWSIFLVLFLAACSTTTQPPVTTSAATPTPSPTPTPAQTSPSVQELAEIENYRATRFYPDRFVVVKDIPVRLYVTRFHLEHVNLFTIEPFVKSDSFFFPPGTLGTIEFTPNQAGEFRIVNEGHDFQATLVVASSADEAKSQLTKTGVQEFSLIHDFTNSRLAPARIVVQKGVPVRVYNTGLGGDDKVSIAPFYVPTATNVEPRKITVFEFTPTMVGEFPIGYEKYKLSGTFVVE
jgi:plastocyanin domain-containing protein